MASLFIYYNISLREYIKIIIFIKYWYNYCVFNKNILQLGINVRKMLKTG